MWLTVHSCIIPSISHQILTKHWKPFGGEGEIAKSRLSIKLKNSIYIVYEGKWHEVENQRSSQRLQATHSDPSNMSKSATDYFCTFVRAEGNAFLMNKTKSGTREHAHVWEVPDAVSKSLLPHQVLASPFLAQAEWQLCFMSMNPKFCWKSHLPELWTWWLDTHGNLKAESEVPQIFSPNYLP